MKGRECVNLKKVKIKERLLEKLHEKLNETLKAVLPIIAIVLLLCFTIAPLEPGILLAFLLGAVLLIVGMMFFTLGVEMSMTPIGENVGICMTQTKKLGVMVLLSFILGFIVTISEPDLQVLAEQVPAVPNIVLVLSVAFGVGLFLIAALLRHLEAFPASANGLMRLSAYSLSSRQPSLHSEDVLLQRSLIQSFRPMNRIRVSVTERV